MTTTFYTFNKMLFVQPISGLVKVIILNLNYITLIA